MLVEYSQNSVYICCYDTPVKFVLHVHTEPPVPMDVEELKAGSRTPPKSLRPCAGDAYLLFQVSFTCVFACFWISCSS